MKKIIFTILVFPFFVVSFVLAADALPTTSIAVSPPTAKVGQEVLVTVQGRDDNGVLALYVNFGDGGGWQLYSCPNPDSSPCSKVWRHAYSRAGNYTLKSQARDNAGQDSDVNQVKVTIVGDTLPVASETGGECPPGQICNPLKYGTFEAIVGAISKFLFNIGLALAPVMLIIAGFMYVTSAGDPNRVGTAKKLALYTLIGLAIILLASGLIKVLESILGVTGT